MCRFKILVQNKNSNVIHEHSGKIRANSIIEAINNIDIAFRCFNYTIVNLKQLN